jgi:tetratricopeptide (TPR) repeat protein
MVLVRRGRPGEAARQFLEVVQLSPRSREARVVAPELARAAESLITDGRLVEARDALRAAIDAGQRTEGAYLNLGLVCFRLGRPDEARDVLSQGVAAVPGSTALQHRLGRLQGASASGQ